MSEFPAVLLYAPLFASVFICPTVILLQHIYTHCILLYLFFYHFLAIEDMEMPFWLSMSHPAFCSSLVSFIINALYSGPPVIQLILFWTNETLFLLFFGTLQHDIPKNNFFIYFVK